MTLFQIIQECLIFKKIIYITFYISPNPLVVLNNSSGNYALHYQGPIRHLVYDLSREGNFANNNKSITSKINLVKYKHIFILLVMMHLLSF